MIKAFAWSELFATDIESVDNQHLQLVHLVNRVGDLMLADEPVGEPQLQEVFKQLADYTRFHFSDEERVMTDAGIDPRHIAQHKEHHHGFTEQVIALWQGRRQMQRPAEILHGFLSAWLTFHILGEDQSMARQIANVQSGMTPEKAYEIEAGHHEHSTSVLLQAMRTLYGVLTLQNRDLAEANRQLEAHVAERTEELKTAYAKLAADNQELTTLLGMIERTQSQLLQSEKMSSIGQLAAGVAHEINNPIGFVSSNLGTLSHYIDDLLQLVDAASDCPAAQAVAERIDLPYLRTDLAALLAESTDGLERVRKIVHNLKDFSRVDEAEWQHADLIAGLESTVNVVWHELKYKTDIVRELKQLPLVRCIPAQVNQVLMNLLVNAAQAINGHGTITLKSGEENGQVWIEVADTGCGMSEEVKHRMFEPFYTTKPVGKGTGLGMSLSYDIIHKHGGSFDVDSAPGAGSRIRIWLPIAGPNTPSP